MFSGVDGREVKVSEENFAISVQIPSGNVLNGSS
jgi:hypothetical protein